MNCFKTLSDTDEMFCLLWAQGVSPPPAEMYHVKVILFASHASCDPMQEETSSYLSSLSHERGYGYQEYLGKAVCANVKKKNQK